MSLQTSASRPTKALLLKRQIVEIVVGKHRCNRGVFWKCLTAAQSPEHIKKLTHTNACLTNVYKLFGVAEEIPVGTRTAACFPDTLLAAIHWSFWWCEQMCHRHNLSPRNSMRHVNHTAKDFIVHEIHERNLTWSWLQVCVMVHK